MRFLPVFLLSAALAIPVAASARDGMMVASDLGHILAGEELCGLTFDEAAIDVWIEKNVDAGDMDFSSMLAMMTKGAAVQMGEMSDAGKAAQCKQITRVAKHYGFIK